MKEMTHCNQPMEVLRLPNSYLAASGLQVGFRCLVCGLIVPNALLDTFIEEARK